MRKSVPLVLIAAIGLSGCGMFGGSRSSQPAVTVSDNALLPEKARVKPLDTRTPIAHVDKVEVARLPGGIIVTATGTAAAQGAYDVALIPNAAGPIDGVWQYTLVANQPAGQPVGTTASRQVIAATRFSDAELAGARSMQIQGATNALTVRR